MNYLSKFCLFGLICLSFFSNNLEANPPRKMGTVQVALDNGNNSVVYAYATQGHNDGRPVVLLSDPYFGINGWKCLQAKLSDDFYTIAIDPLGSGLSSKNDPLLLDGVAGQQGYSYKQQAIFTNTLLQKLNAKGPVIWVGVDVQGNVGAFYAAEFANQVLPLSKLVLVSSSVYPVVSDDPCLFGFLTTAQAQALAAFYAQDPCTALCVLLDNSFITTESPAAEQIQKNAAVKFSATTPSNIFTRLITQTYKDYIAPLMPQINIPVLTLYGLTSDASPLSRPTTGAVFVPFCPSCPGYNPSISETCACGQALTKPFSDVRLLVYPGHGTCLQVSAFKRFYRDLTDFITGADSDCTLCPFFFDSPDTCPDCSF